ncbi:MAG: TolC family protein [Saprospiraceae bacterium]|nr:TolC family protein [Saprospiraceae bacterium]
MRLALKIVIIILPGMIRAQEAFTPDAAVRAALQNHPGIKAAAFEVQAKKYAEKTAINLPNPEVNVESPTGLFYAVGVLQSFEFPTVYARQKQVAKAETALAQAGQLVNENELRYAVRTLYLEAQVAAFQSRQWMVRDSLYQAIAAAAVRQFASGEIDFLQKNLAENEAGKVHQERLGAEQLALTLYEQLKTQTGIPEPGALLPLHADTTGLGDASGAFPAVLYEQRAAQVAEKQIGLAKSRALPNFSIGYMNQGERETPIDYRFRASVGLPLWAGQYRAGINVAKAETQAATARAAAQNQAAALQLQRSRTEMFTALSSIRYYEQEGLPRSRALLSAVLRMREAGQTDYVIFMKTLDEVFAMQRDYAVQIQAFETARIQISYLTGR